MGNRNDIENGSSEYDFAAIGKPVRGKYAQRFQEGTNIVLLDADIAKRFRTSEEVNEALRQYLAGATIGRHGDDEE